MIDEQGGCRKKLSKISNLWHIKRKSLYYSVPDKSSHFNLEPLSQRASKLNLSGEERGVYLKAASDPYQPESRWAGMGFLFSAQA
jgi:hypothetical protein